MDPARVLGLCAARDVPPERLGIAGKGGGNRRLLTQCR